MDLVSAVSFVMHAGLKVQRRHRQAVVPRLRAFPCLAAACLATATAALAQTPATDAPAPSQKSSLTITSQLVVVDVSVLDKRGQAVAGLKREDFSVTEDGQSRPIRSFAEVDGSIAVMSQPSLHTVLVLDDLNTPLLDAAYARSEMIAYIKRQPQPLTAPTMLVVVDDAGFGMVHGYTLDRDALLATLQHQRAGLPFSQLRGDKRTQWSITLDALQQIAIANGDIPGRKAIVWVGAGFPALSVSTEQESNIFAAFMQRMTTLLLRSRVVLYGIDPAAVGDAAVQEHQGLDQEDSDAQDTTVDVVTFRGLVEGSGGRYLFNRNDVDTEIAQTVKQASAYYTISFTPLREVTPNLFRPVRILVRTPGLVVHNRTGYFTGNAVRPEPTPKMVENDVDSAVINNLEYTALALQISAVRPAAAGNEDIVSLRLNATGLPWEATDGNQQTTRVIYAAATYSAKGKPLSFTRSAAQLTVPVPARGATLMTTFDVPVHIPADATRLRVVVLSPEIGKLGSAELKPIVTAKTPAK